jgi:hypothetical protein
MRFSKRLFYNFLFTIISVSLSSQVIIIDENTELEIKEDTLKTTTKDSLPIVKKSEPLIDTLKSIHQNEKAFEGILTFQKQLKNPNKLLITDEEFYRDIPNGGKSIAYLYIKGNRYKWIYEDQIEVYHPNGNKVCIKHLKKDKDTFYCLPTHLEEDKPNHFEKMTQKSQVLGQSCQVFAFKNLFEKRIFHFNPVSQKTNGAAWLNHHKDFWGTFLSKSNSFPLKIEVSGMMHQYSLTCIKIEKKSLTDKDFQF